MWKFAGAKAFVLIFHEKLGQWRAVEIDHFLTREGGSWDLRQFELMTLEKAFEKYTCLQS